MDVSFTIFHMDLSSDRHGLDFIHWSINILYGWIFPPCISCCALCQSAFCAESAGGAA